MITNQHGDLLIKKINNIPSEAIEIEIKNNFVVEKGEGVHTHVIKDTKNVKILMTENDMYLNVLKDIEIDHEEHGVQTIEKGKYIKRIERQFDYENEIERKVMD
jgi:RecB family endonuclease NucS